MGPLTFVMDLALGLGMLITMLTHSCSFPPALLYRQVMFGVIWALGLAGAHFKKWRI